MLLNKDILIVRLGLPCSRLAFPCQRQREEHTTSCSYGRNLVADKVPHRIDDEYSMRSLPLSLEASALLYHVRMTTDDRIYALVSKPLSKLSLYFIGVLLVLISPVNLYNLIFCTQAVSSMEIATDALFVNRVYDGRVGIGNPLVP